MTATLILRPVDCWVQGATKAHVWRQKLSHDGAENSLVRWVSPDGDRGRSRNPNELVMIADLRDAAAFHYGNSIHMQDGRNPVGYDDGGVVAEPVVHRLLDIRSSVNTSRAAVALLSKIKLASLINRPGDSYPLPLSSRKPDSFLSHDRLITLG